MRNHISIRWLSSPYAATLTHLARQLPSPYIHIWWRANSPLRGMVSGTRGMFPPSKSFFVDTTVCDVIGGDKSGSWNEYLISSGSVSSSETGLGETSLGWRGNFCSCRGAEMGDLTLWMVGDVLLGGEISLSWWRESLLLIGEDCPSGWGDKLLECCNYSLG